MEAISPEEARQTAQRLSLPIPEAVEVAAAAERMAMSLVAEEEAASARQTTTS